MLDSRLPGYVAFDHCDAHPGVGHIEEDISVSLFGRLGCQLGAFAGVMLVFVKGRHGASPDLICLENAHGTLKFRATIRLTSISLDREQ